MKRGSRFLGRIKSKSPFLQNVFLLDITRHCAPMRFADSSEPTVNQIMFLYSSLSGQGVDTINSAPNPQPCPHIWECCHGLGRTVTHVLPNVFAKVNACIEASDKRSSLKRDLRF
jgi:hypothetical protein